MGDMDLPDGVLTSTCLGVSLLCLMEEYSHHLLDSKIDELIDGGELKALVYMECWNLLLMELAYRGLARQAGFREVKNRAKNGCPLFAGLETIRWCHEKMLVLAAAMHLHDAASVNVVFRSIGDVLSPRRNEKLMAIVERLENEHEQKDDGS